MTTHIVVDPSSFRLGKVGPSTGEIWLAFDSIAFPAPRWNDFVVVILEAWAAALLRILRGSSSFERVHFMDGPFEVEIRRASDDELQLLALERGSIEKARVSVSMNLLVADLLAAADAIVIACRESGDMSTDSARLERALPAMRVEFGKMTN